MFGGYRSILSSLVLVGTTLCTVRCIGPIIDEVILSPLANLPLKSCTSKMESINHMTCCKTTCHVQPMDGIRSPVLHDIFIECLSHNRTVDCNDILTQQNINRLEQEMGTSKKHPVRKEAEKEMKKTAARLNVAQTVVKVLKWYARLFLTWLFQKSFDRTFKMFMTLAKTLLTS